MNIALTKHKHADLILEKARQEATGETDAEWWQWEYKVTGCLWDKAHLWEPMSRPNWSLSCEYRFCMTDKHPVRAPSKPKPKLKLVDMLRLPVRSIVRVPGSGNYPYVVMGIEAPWVVLWNSTDNTRKAYPTYLRIAEQTEFTYWGGGLCPVSEGLMVQVVLRDRTCIKCAAINPNISWRHPYYSSINVIGYRIIGLAEGWTDDPALAAGSTT